MHFLLLVTVLAVQNFIPFLMAEIRNNSLPIRNMTTPNIFCEGKILQYISMARVFNHSNGFLDKKLKYKPNVVHDNFEIILNKTDNRPSASLLRKFVDTNFESSSNALHKYVPIDWKPKPSFTSDIYDSNLRDWILEVNSVWRYLGREMSEDVKNNSEMYSLIYVPHPFIVPGGIFKEYYYWDSYWIIEGLLLSEMYLTAQQMIKNYLYLVEELGYVPNGGRTYYLGRSQPPYLIPMFELYYDATKDEQFLRESIATLEKEFNFWRTNRMTHVNKNGLIYEVYQYSVDMEEPRPESYYEDMTNAQKLPNSSRGEFFSQIRSAAESGWDFSSRWFIDGKQRSKNILHVNPKALAPVCLNSLMGKNAKLLSKFYYKLSDRAKGDQYLALSQNINQTLSRLFWSEAEGIWLDFNIRENELQSGFYPSSLMPLWTDMYGMERDRKYTIERVVNYLERINITSYRGGMPTSLIESNQQWDLPNGWAPLQHMAVLGLHEAGKEFPRAEKLAYEIGKNWILNGFVTYQNSTPPAMFEKYNVVHPGVPGAGGEYVVQQGFGWSNGVVMKLLSIYGHKIKTTDGFDPAPTIVGVTLLLVASITIYNYYRGQVDSRTENCKFDILMESMD